jgi:putative ABC transport system permease protein
VYSLRILTDQHDAISQRRISDQIQALYEKSGIQFSSTQLGADWIRDQKSQTDILVYFMLSMAVMIAIVGGLGLMGL